MMHYVDIWVDQIKHNGIKSDDGAGIGLQMNASCTMPPSGWHLSAVLSGGEGGETHLAKDVKV